MTKSVQVLLGSAVLRSRSIRILDVSHNQLSDSSFTSAPSTRFRYWETAGEHPARIRAWLLELAERTVGSNAARSRTPSLPIPCPLLPGQHSCAAPLGSAADVHAFCRLPPLSSLSLSLVLPSSIRGGLLSRLRARILAACWSCSTSPTTTFKTTAP